MIKVSVVIVSMNNNNHLFKCLDCIKYLTSNNYEVIVVAYLYSLENLVELKKRYPWIRLVESNEIRGFSENNNLGLKIAKGEYCFILNDDTFFSTPVIDELLLSIENIKDATILSPDIRYPDGRYQICGRRRYDWKYWIIASFEVERYFYGKSEFENGKGVFQTYNISGAAFLIKTDIFRSFGFFDEIYFFSPEDIALSTKVNINGMKCYVDENIKLYHVASSTSSRIQSATMPSHTMGSLIFFSNGDKALKLLLASIVFFARSLKGGFALVRSVMDRKYLNLAKANFNTCAILFSNLTPKAIFLRYYNKLRF